MAESRAARCSEGTAAAGRREAQSRVAESS